MIEYLNNMTWPQYRDTAQTLARLYDVREFPTYILIDADGILRDRKIGFGLDNASWLNDRLKKWVSAVKSQAGGSPVDLFLRPTDGCGEAGLETVIGSRGAPIEDPAADA